MTRHTIPTLHEIRNAVIDLQLLSYAHAEAKLAAAQADYRLTLKKAEAATAAVKSAGGEKATGENEAARSRFLALVYAHDPAVIDAQAAADEAALHERMTASDGECVRLLIGALTTALAAGVLEEPEGYGNMLGEAGEDFEPDAMAVSAVTPPLFDSAAVDFTGMTETCPRYGADDGPDPLEHVA